MKTKNYKWELRKGSKKEICPSCGKKRFVPYVSVLDGRTLAGSEYGRCDREQHCGYSKYPGGVDTSNIEHIERPAAAPLVWFPAFHIVVSYSTPLFTFASNTFGEERARSAWDEYRIGADGKRTVFWQIDKNGVIRTGKSIPYKEDAHRDKNDPFPCSWCHRSRTYDGMHEGEELHQCLFGEHLLATYPDKDICVVESEKTALFMSLIAPKYLWLACGGSNGLSDDKLKVLKGRNVTLNPDNGQFYKWQSIAEKNLFKIDKLTKTSPKFEGCDILDYFV